MIKDRDQMMRDLNFIDNSLRDQESDLREGIGIVVAVHDDGECAFAKAIDHVQNRSLLCWPCRHHAREE